MIRELARPMVTGGAGFIGSAMVRLLLGEREVERVTVLDKLTYAGSLAKLPAGEPRLDFVRGDVADRGLVGSLLESRRITGVLHLAAESHVDRSIESSEDFLHTNILGTANLLECCRAAGLPLLHCSTDEVYGSVESPGRFREDSPLRPSSPYSASKAAADMLCLAAHATYGQDVVITRGTNNYGPRQHPEKLIPRMIWCALRGGRLPVYGDGLQVRDWIHVEDHCRGMVAAWRRGGPGESYLLGADREIANLALVKEILRLLGKPESLIEHVADRPGHDRRYAVDSAKARRELGWEPRVDFTTAFPEVVRQLAEDLIGA